MISIIKDYKNGTEFYNDNSELLNNNEIDYQFFITNALTWSEKPCDSKNFFIKIAKNDLYIMACELESFPMAIAGSEKLVSDLMDVLLSKKKIITGIISSEILTKEFIKNSKLPGAFSLLHSMDVMTFVGRGKTNPNIRRCTKEDLDTIANMIIAFHNEINDPKYTKEEAIKVASNKLDSIYGYYEKDTLVSILCLTRPTKKYIAFSLAYTTKKYRNKGIMQDLMLHCAAIAARMNKTPQLFVDKTNPISNHLYRKIGFDVYLSNYHYQYRE